MFGDGERMTAYHSPHQSQGESAGDSTLSASQRARQAQSWARRQARQAARDGRRVALEERRRTRLERFAFWAVEGTIDDLKDRPIGAMISFTEGRLAAGLLVSVVLGFLLDFSVSLMGTGHDVTYIVLGAATGATITWIAGGAGGGVGGAALGGLWGWLAGKIAESLAGDIAKQGLNPGGDWGRQILIWPAVLGIGWVAGCLARSVYARTANGVSRFIISAILVGAITMVLWDLGERHRRYVDAVQRSIAWLNHHSWIVVVLTLATFACLVIVLLAAWIEHSLPQPHYTYTGVPWERPVLSFARSEETFPEWAVGHRWIVYLFVWSGLAAGGAIWAALTASDEPVLQGAAQFPVACFASLLLLLAVLRLPYVVIWLGSVFLDGARIAKHTVTMLLRGPAGRNSRQIERDRRIRETAAEERFEQAIARLDPQMREVYEEVVRNRIPIDDPRVEALGKALMVELDKTPKS